ncbi:MAG: ABC transporter ATP-binding protein [Deltaproteobacteria bacterium]|nr:ABC transporter ATP-binding protein [Deltaproteobacteria bacterium]
MTEGSGAKSTSELLEIQDICLSFGGVNALLGVGFGVRRGEIHSLIGPNGAGKSTLLNVISGLSRPQRGAVLYRGRNLVALPPHKIAGLGIGRGFQQVSLVMGMTVLDNLLLGRHARLRTGFFRSAFFWGGARREELEQREIAEELIGFLGMSPFRDQLVGALSYGLRKRLELGRALALEPELLLLDEPLSGMNREEIAEMVRFIVDINQKRFVTVLLVEHDMDVVMELSDRVTVLNFGELLITGTPVEVQNNPLVISAYLGVEDSFLQSGRAEAIVIRD